MRILDSDPDTVARCCALSASVGWNQTAADWQMMLRAGRGFAVEERGVIAATAMYLTYEPSVAWICMVMTRPEFRRKGLATALMQKCIGEAEARGLVPMLDATAAGAEVYQRLGFVGGAEISRLMCDVQRDSGPESSHPISSGISDVSISPVGQDDRLSAEIVALDAEVYGVDRSAILEDIIARAPELCYACLNDEQRMVGFCLGRQGRDRRHIGPVVVRGADDEAAAVAAELVARSAALPGRTLIDVPDQHEELLHRLRAAGFERQRGYIRMARPASGHDARFAYLNRVFGIGGPAIG